jgi:hypothetical protein
MVVGLSVAVPGSSHATADPTHNVDTAKLINYNAGGFAGSDQCAVRYQHGNIYATAYSKIKRGYDFTQLSASSSSYATAGVRYGWGVTYPNMPDGVTVRCTTMQTFATVSYSGNLLEYSSAADTGNGTWLQATGPVYSSLVGSQGWVWGPTNGLGNQAIAAATFPGL